MTVTQMKPNMDHWEERVDLAAAFRWTARLNMHEGVANHFGQRILSITRSVKCAASIMVITVATIARTVWSVTANSTSASTAIAAAIASKKGRRCVSTTPA